MDLLSFWPFFVSFNIIYMTSYFAFKHVPSLGFSFTNQPIKAASRVTAMVHSTSLLPFVTYFVIQSINYPITTPLLNYVSPLTSFELTLLSWSASYFFQDFFHFILFERNDLFLLFHHIFSLVFFWSVYHLNVGGLAMCVAILTGESTNPLQTIWTLAKIGHHERVFDFISPIFTVTFIFMRSFVVPVWVFDIIVNGFVPAVNKGTLPVIYAIGWSFLCVAMTIGGLIWSVQLAKGFKKRYLATGIDSKVKGSTKLHRLASKVISH